MLQRILYRLLHRRHHWRRVSFDEVAQLYVSRLMTVFAINIINLFAAIYLYKLGYSLVFIALFYGALYMMKVLLSPLAGRYVAWWGPKHGIFAANMLRIPSLLFFLGVEQYGIVMVIAFGVFQQVASCLYDLSYLVDFSKVKHRDHAGKEIGTMQILEKVARIISPLAGGIIATMLSPQYAIAVAAVIFSLAAWPLFRTAEPTPTRLRLEMPRVRLREIWRVFVGESVIGFDFIASGVAWSLFLVVVVFAAYDDQIYAIVGGMASIGVVISALGAYAFGRMIDRRGGEMLLVSTSIAKAVLHMVRPVSVTPIGAVVNSMGSEVTTTGYSMAFIRVMFDGADNARSRIAYMTYMEIAINIGASLGCLLFAAALAIGGVQGGFATIFVVAAGVQMLLLLSRRLA